MMQLLDLCSVLGYLVILSCIDSSIYIPFQTCARVALQTTKDALGLLITHNAAVEHGSYLQMETALICTTRLLIDLSEMLKASQEFLWKGDLLHTSVLCLCKVLLSSLRYPQTI